MINCTEIILLKRLKKCNNLTEISFILDNLDFDFDRINNDFQDKNARFQYFNDFNYPKYTGVMEYIEMIYNCIKMEDMGITKYVLDYLEYSGLIKSMENDEQKEFGGLNNNNEQIKILISKIIMFLLNKNNYEILKYIIDKYIKDCILEPYDIIEYRNYFKGNHDIYHYLINFIDNYPRKEDIFILNINFIENLDIEL